MSAPILNHDTPSGGGRASAAPGRRRGSALIITVGTLALIAVIAAFYVTLGQTDTRVSRGVERGAEIEAVEGQIADYIAQIIADDRSATTIETITNNEDDAGAGVDATGNPITPNAANRQRFIREATDYPFTDFAYKSIFSAGDPMLGEGGMEFNSDAYVNTPDVFGNDQTSLAAAAERFRFRPTGEHTVMLATPGLDLFGQDNEQFLRDYRVASDPWLASSEPTFTGLGDNPNQPLRPAERRVFSAFAGATGGTTINGTFTQDFPEYHYLDNRDWAQISNLAPDGLSINLFNLRGNFDAQSGLGVDSTGRSRMSENRTLLTLVSPQSGTPDGLLIRASDRLHFDPNGQAVASILANTPEAFAIRNTPAWWTMNQRFLYFPADADFQILGRALPGDSGNFLTPQTWEHPDYPDYQYADADGDGFYDSRWFELTDSTLGFLGTRSLLKNETDLRFFVAARVVDLSGRVNVNSATDSLVPPTSDAPIGSTPAEIDLRRLLTMQDPAEQYRPVFANTEIPANSNLVQPTPAQQRLSYSHIKRLPFTDRQAQNANALVAGDYESYFNVRSTRFEPRVSVLQGPGVDIGRFAYDALRREIQGDALYLPSAATNLRNPTDGDAVSYQIRLRDGTPFEYFAFDPALPEAQRLYPSQNVFGADVVFGWSTPGSALPGEYHAQLRQLPLLRRDYWYDIGGVNIADPDDTPQTRDGLGARLFGLDDLSELLAFNGVNDDRTLSRLERVTQGRFQSATNENLDVSTLRFGPLRANRPTALERTGHDVRENTVAPGTTQFPVGDNLIDDEVFALNALNPRLRLTTISGAAPLRARVVEDLDRDGTLSPEERSLTSLDTRLDLTPSPVVVNESTTNGGTQLSVTGPSRFGRTGASGSFLADGFRPGMKISVTGFVNPENNGTFTVTDVDAGVITVAEDRLVVESPDLGRQIAALGNAERPEILYEYYADALAPYAEVDGTWNANPEGNDPTAPGSITQPAYPQMRTLAYGYRGSELALRLSAHLSVNMADMYDEDDEPSAYTVIASGDQAFRQTFETSMASPNPIGTAATPYHWWADGKRLDLGPSELAPTQADLNNDDARSIYNVYGVEPQPVITEVAVVSIFTDVPRSQVSSGPLATSFDGTNVGSEDENPGLPPFQSPYHNENRFVYGGDSDPPSPEQPADDGPADDITIRADISPENPDLVAHLLAVQLTNPFDVPIRLSGEDTTPNGATTDGGALNTVPGQLESVKYYLEYNGHFFPLAQFFERAANVNPATGVQYNAQTLSAEEINRNQPNRLYPVTLRPGESRVFYVSAHPSLQEMNQRWLAIDEVYGSTAGTDDFDGSGIRETPVNDRANRNLFEEFIASQFTVLDDDGLPLNRVIISADTFETPGAAFRADVREPVRLIPFDPRNGLLAVAGQTVPNGGTFVDFQRTSIAVRNPANADAQDRMRQEVRLWRRMTVSEDGPFTGNPEAETYRNNAINWIENDLLVDRLRDPILPRQDSLVQDAATLDFAALTRDQASEIRNRDFTEFQTTLRPGPGSFDWSTPVNLTIPNTTSTDDSFGQWSNTSQGMTIARFAGYRRPDHLEEVAMPGVDAVPVLNDKGRLLRGLLPAWAIEGREMNYNIATPTLEDVQFAADIFGSPRVPAAPGTLPPALEAIDNIMNADLLDQSLGGEIVGWQDNGGFTADSDFEPYFARNLRSVMRRALPATEPNTEVATPFLPIATGTDRYLPGNGGLIPTIRRHPDHKAGPIEDNGLNDFDDDPNDFERAARDGLNAAGVIKPSRPFTPTIINSEERTIATSGAEPLNARQALLYNNSDRFGFDNDEPRTTRIRAADLLMPLAVGPTFAPRFGAFAQAWPWSGPANFRPNDWTTLPEALAAALGLEPPAFYNKDPDFEGYSLLCELVERSGLNATPASYDGSAGPRPLTVNVFGTNPDTGSNAELEMVLDNGRLHLGEYTPFYNGNDDYLAIATGNPFGFAPTPNSSTLGVSVSFNPTDPAGNDGQNVDHRVGFSIPPAQRLVSMAQAIGRGGDPLTTPVIGTININTAPEAVLRTIPGLATPLQFSRSNVDYDQYEPENLVTNFTATGNTDLLMEWGPGRVFGKTFLRPVPRETGTNAPLPIPFGIGDPFELLPQGFVGDGWRNVGEIAPNLAAFRDRTAASFRVAAREPFGNLGGSGGTALPAQGLVINGDLVYDYTPYFPSTPNNSLSFYAFGEDAFGPDSNNITRRQRDVYATNFARDYARSAVSGHIGASERPGFEGAGALLSLDVPRREALTSPFVTAVQNPRLRDATATGPAGGQGNTWRPSVQEKVLQGTMARLGRDTVVDPANPNPDPLALGAVDQDWNNSGDPNEDTPPLNWNPGFEDGYGPITDPIEADNFSYTLGRALFANDSADDDLRPRVLEDELANDLLEELAIFNGLSNTVDVRSDFYAAWFVVRGYSESDVTALDPDEPMTPSYQKRFLMVIDRSNVTDVGQSPRVLLFREVPL